MRRSRAVAESPAIELDLPEKYLAQIRAALRTHVPTSDVWAFGSRVCGASHDASDLDLVLRNPTDLGAVALGLADLKEAFIESDLPIRVEIMDWARIPERFRREIERAYVVIETASL